MNENHSINGVAIKTRCINDKLKLTILNGDDVVCPFTAATTDKSTNVEDTAGIMSLTMVSVVVVWLFRNKIFTQKNMTRKRFVARLID